MIVLLRILRFHCVCEYIELYTHTSTNIHYLDSDDIIIYIDICITYQRLPNHRLSTLCSWLQELRDCIFMGFVTKFEALRHRKNRFRFAAWLPFTSKVGLCFTLGVGNAGAICVHLIHLVSFCFCIALSCWDVLLSRQDYTEGGFTRGWFRIQCMEPSDSECMGKTFWFLGWCQSLQVWIIYRRFKTFRTWSLWTKPCSVCPNIAKRRNVCSKGPNLGRCWVNCHCGCADALAFLARLQSNTTYYVQVCEYCRNRAAKFSDID